MERLKVLIIKEHQQKSNGLKKPFDLYSSLLRPAATLREISSGFHLLAAICKVFHLCLRSLSEAKDNAHINHRASAHSLMPQSNPLVIMAREG